MKNIKYFAATLLLAGAVAGAAMPAQAQPRRDAWNLTPARNMEIRQDINQLGNAIDRAAARRSISPREAAGLRNQTRSVQRLYASYARDGLNRSEVQALQARVNQVRVALRMERRDWDGRRG